MVPAWAHLTLRRINESDYADIILVILNAIDHTTQVSSRRYQAAGEKSRRR
jgi:hypothetical protein